MKKLRNRVIGGLIVLGCIGLVAFLFGGLEGIWVAVQIIMGVILGLIFVAVICYGILVMITGRLGG